MTASGNDAAPEKAKRATAHETSGLNLQARSCARLAAVQALYQMEAAGAGVEAVIEEFSDYRLGQNLDSSGAIEADLEFFSEILRGAVLLQEKLDKTLKSHLASGWSLKRIDSTARAILRAGLFELVRREDIPYRVVIDEYVEIANAFFDGDEPAFINGVLDSAAREIRAGEMRS